MKNKRTPDIRFAGFTGDWEQRKLKDILIEKISNGMMNRPGKNQLGVKNINVVNLYSPSYIHEDELEYIDATEKEVYKYNVEVGDIFLTRSSLKVEGIAQANILLALGTYVFDDHIMRMKLNKGYSNFFVKEMLNHNYVKKQFMSKSKTGTMTTIGQEDISSSYGIFPSFREQEKIGSVLFQIDNLITLQQQEITTLKQTKQGFLQKMFPKKGESVPEVRFPGFTGDWEQRRLGEMLKERNEQIPENEEYPLMSFVQGKGVTPKGDRYDRSFLVKDDNKKYKKTELGDFIYSSNNLETGSIGFNKTGKAVISPVYSIFSSKNKLESQFVGILSTRKDFIWKMVRFRQGVVYGQWRIHEKDFLDIQISVPSHNEQEEIIGFFANLDNLITLHQRELDVLKETKKAFLQKMFV
ncbi:TPA: restriction endonuclease subunit S [Bacillus cereus]